MSYVKKVALVGATGTIGKHILEELLRAGKHEVTAITRSDSTAVIPDGVKVAKVNYEDPKSLIEGLRGQQALIITMNPMAPKETQLNLIEAAGEAGVPWVIPNGWGYDTTHASSDDAFLGPGQRAVQEYVEKVGKSSWIEFVSGPWYEFSLGGSADRYGFDFQNRSVIFYDDGKARINTSTWEQTGRAVAKVLALKEYPDNKDDKSLTLSSYKNKSVYFSSFLVSQKDMFDSVLRVTGTENDEWKVTYENSSYRYQSGLELMKSGVRTGFMRAMYVRSFYPEGSGYGSSAHEARHGISNEALGLPVENLDERTAIAIQMSEDLVKKFT
ncbi:hypothetical protein G7046_g3747 [Stylonectria norvegica]|nr:hypothetical protein G7046_g3747 [Stylonectria norvegica]